MDTRRLWGLGLVAFFIVSISVQGQSFRLLHTFTATATFAGTNSDGVAPTAALALSDDTLYGAAVFGGSFGNGTVFKVKSDGTGFATLHSFGHEPLLTRYSTNSDGAHLYNRLAIGNGTLYGTAKDGGSSGLGTVFGLRTDGSGFIVLHNFTGHGEGANPFGSVILSDDALYGTTSDLGAFSSSGTVFSVNTNGALFKTLKSFVLSGSAPPLTNSDGGILYAGLVASGSTLYGMAFQGGPVGDGTIFKIHTDGSGFTNLHNFTSTGDGGYPNSPLIVSGNKLYGTTSAGTIFSLSEDGTSFTNLHTFSGSEAGFPLELILSGATLYGVTRNGGSSNNGTVFCLQTDGTGFVTIYTFTAGLGAFPSITNVDGAYPGALVLSGNCLYGTTEAGGNYGNGTIFSLSFVPELTIVPFQESLILTWPTNYAGFDYSGYSLQSTTNLASPIWTTNLPAPFVVNGQYTVTNPISGQQQFFRLSQP